MQNPQTPSVNDQALVQGPVELSPELLTWVSGGAPKNTWNEADAETTAPKNTW